MKGASDWLNKNPKQAGIGAGIAFLLAGLILYFFVLPGAPPGPPVPAPGGGPGTTGGPGGGMPPGMPGPGGAGGGMQMAMVAPGGGGAASDDAIVKKGTKPWFGGRANPMEPWWPTAPDLVRPVPASTGLTTTSGSTRIATAPNNIPSRSRTMGTGTSSGTTTVGAAAPQYPTPPTPGVFSHSRAYWELQAMNKSGSSGGGMGGGSGGSNSPPVPHIVINYIPAPNVGTTGGADQPFTTISPSETPERMAGILYSPERVVAVLEKGSKGYVVQPGDPVEGGDRVVAISPDSVTLENRGARRTVSLRSGSLKGLPKAQAQQPRPTAAYGAGMGGPGYGYGAQPNPGYGGYAPAPGYGSPGYGAPSYGAPGYGAPGGGIAPPPPPGVPPI